MKVMFPLILAWWALWWSVSGGPVEAPVSIRAKARETVGEPRGAFEYDDVSELPTSRLSDERAYDASVLVHGDAITWTWLWFEPGVGDRLFWGEGPRPQEVVGAALEDTPRALAHPLLSRDGRGRIWLTYEGAVDGRWRVFARCWDGRGFGPPWVLGSASSSSAVCHDADGTAEGLWVAWQEDRDGTFAVVAAEVTDAGVVGEPVLVSLPTDRTSAGGAWAPDAVVTATGERWVAYDQWYDGSYDVFLWRGSHGTGVLAKGPEYAARPRTAADPDGGVWVVFEQSGPGWGQPHRGLDKTWNTMTDVEGPLHNWREIRGVHVDRAGNQRPMPELPQPMFVRGANRADLRPEARKVGVYYERPEVAADGAGRLWVAWRHFGNLQCATTQPCRHHVEEGFQVALRCLTPSGWGPAMGMTVHQRDGGQRLALASEAQGVLCAFDVGRTDRRPLPGQAIGVLSARAAAPVGERTDLGEVWPDGPATGWSAVKPGPRAAEPTITVETIGETAWRPHFGDLHRHTDLSLCFPFFDGSLDDTYRYAIDAAELDFLGITDHARDLKKGDVGSLVWWRCTKEVERRRIANGFVPYFAYERSHGDTDHNVISLRSDMLRNFPPPLPEFWAEITDRDTFTIPHNPYIGKIWDYQDDDKRPLVEVYQGFRDQPIHQEVHTALRRGYHLGFIASSDHLSTGASFAVVWSQESDREALFRSLQARRTYGASAPIRLVFRTGEHWMGERVESSSAPTFLVDAVGTGPLRRVDVWCDGEVVAQIPVEGIRGRGTWSAPEWESGGEHWVYVTVEQMDGHGAWSSPIWIRRR